MRINCEEDMRVEKEKTRIQQVDRYCVPAVD